MKRWVWAIAAVAALGVGCGGSDPASSTTPPDVSGSWTLVDQQTNGVKALATDGTTLFAGTWSGVLVSTDEGASWSPTALDSDIVTRFAIIPDTSGGPASVFAAKAFGGIARSSDGFATWSDLAPSVGMGAGEFWDLIAEGTNLYGASNSIYLSTDFGESWADLQLRNLGTRVVAFVDSTLVTVTQSNGVFTTTDNGVTWNQVNSTLDAFPNALVVKGQTLFLCADEGVFRSTDLGATWTQLTGIPSGGSTAAFVEGDRLYVTTGEAPYVSVDDGETFTRVGSDWPVDSVATAVVVQGNFLIAGAGNNGKILRLELGQ